MACAQVVNIFLHVSVESEVSQPWILLKRGEAELQTETMPALDTAHFRTPHFLRSLSLSPAHTLLPLLVQTSDHIIRQGKRQR